MNDALDPRLLACRVCGLIQVDPPWGEDGASPNFLLCACCGTEFGYEHCTPTAIAAARAAWMESGAAWRDSRLRPADWDIESQLRQAPFPDGQG